MDAKVGVPSANSQTKQIVLRTARNHTWPVSLGNSVIVRKPVTAATRAFIEHSAKAASDLLGGSLRARALLPVVFARAKYLARCAKREADMIALARDQFAARMRAAVGDAA